MKHGIRQVKTAPFVPPVLVSEPLNDVQKEQIRHVRNSVHALCPEAVAFVKSLTDDGLIRGWRDVGEARLIKPKEVRA